MELILINITLGVIASAVFSTLVYATNMLLRKRRAILASEYQAQMRALRQLQYYIALEKEYVEELKLHPDTLGRSHIRMRAQLASGLAPQRIYSSDIARKIARLEKELAKVEVAS